MLRISGPNTSEALRALIGPLPPPREARLVRFHDPESKETLDRGLVLWFPAPGSFTGEDMAELHLHGGRAVAGGLVAALSRMPGLHPAEPGEFTRRGFLNGKFDLTKVEAIADLINAETESQRRQAMRQLEGAFAKLLESWRERLVRALSYAEAAIDFAEDDAAVGTAKTKELAAGVAAEIAKQLDDGRRGERLREGFEIAILGPPNAGKSSILNCLAGREAAIVSARAGTTRDVIETRLDLGGFAVTVADTAGLRQARNDIESEGVRRALARAESADLKLVVVEAPFLAQGKIVSSTKRIIDADTIVVANKTDLWRGDESVLDRIESVLRSWNSPALALVAVSAKTGDGISDLLRVVERAVAENLDKGGAEAPAITRARHRAALEECLAALKRFAAANESELAAEDLRLAVRAIGRVTGRVDVEDLLDVIFRDFCIGK